MSFDTNRFSWSRNARSKALIHKGPFQCYEVHACADGFALMALTTGDVWFLPANSEDHALELADPIIYDVHS